MRPLILMITIIPLLSAGAQTSPSPDSGDMGEMLRGGAPLFRPHHYQRLPIPDTTSKAEDPNEIGNLLFNGDVGSPTGLYEAHPDWRTRTPGGRFVPSLDSFLKLCDRSCRRQVDEFCKDNRWLDTLVEPTFELPFGAIKLKLRPTAFCDMPAVRDICTRPPSASAYELSPC